MRGHHIGMTVRSLDESVAFYRVILGMELLFTGDTQAPYLDTLLGYPGVRLRLAVLQLPRSEMTLELLEYHNIEQTEIDHRHGNIGTAHLALHVDDLDEIYARLRADGIRSVSAPVAPTAGPNAGGKVVYMIDPNGVRVELIEGRDRYAAPPSAATVTSQLDGNKE